MGIAAVLFGVALQAREAFFVFGFQGFDGLGVCGFGQLEATAHSNEYGACSDEGSQGESGERDDEKDYFHGEGRVWIEQVMICRAMRLSIGYLAGHEANGYLISIYPVRRLEWRP